MLRDRFMRWPWMRLVRIDSDRRALLAEATACLLIARVALMFVSFPHLARRLGTFVPPGDARTIAMQSPAMPDDARQAETIGWAVTRAARYVPFNAVCLPQAMAARFMLSRRGIKSVMHFGAAKGTDKSFDAHAWLDAAGVEVTGFPAADDFAEIACFV
jgi:Transglutaminase-like superfamily